eukprot:15038403-Heterocapsa_arctica.AAC.1
MSLDLKLSTSLGKIVRAGPAMLASQLMAKEFDFAAKGRMIMGRQMAYMIYSHFQTNPNMDFSSGIADLTEMRWHGDRSIPSFIFLWRQIVTRMR